MDVECVGSESRGTNKMNKQLLEIQPKELKFICKPMIVCVITFSLWVIESTVIIKKGWHDMFDP